MTAAFAEAWRTAVVDEPNAWVRAVAWAEVAGRPAAIAVAGPTLAAWDLESGAPLIRSSIPGEQADSTLLNLTIGRLDRTPIAVTADVAGRVRAWDLAGGEPLGKPIAELYGRAAALVAARELLLIGRGAGATSSVYEVPASSGSVEVWDITAGQSIHSLWHGGYTDSLAVVEHGDRTVAVVGSTYAARPLLDPDDAESQLTTWDIRTGATLGEPILLTGNSVAEPMAAGVLDGRAVAVVAGGEGLCLWDLAERRQRTTVACPGRIEAIVWGELASGPVVLAGGGDVRADGRNWLRLWDPRDWRLIAEASTGTGGISSCAIAPDGSVIVPWGDRVQLLRRPETP
ncbi:WD40 repeat domain-containing protein [Nocardia sp. NPDC006044]|uniref:WD40 repeat domain-containing protein n=1 Tax=Nocardia sp. NPDC006044 TaxID=3364306 RepID=UPI003688A710